MKRCHHRSVRPLLALLLAATVLGLVVQAPLADPGPASAAATCSQYDNQAAAQRAKDTRDTDGDGVYCESLPCPCLKPGAKAKPVPTKPRSRGCVRPRSVAKIGFSKTKYPRIRAHFLRALRKGWPGTLVLNRPGASSRRDRLLRGIPTRRGYDRDEYPPAVGRGRGRGLTKGVRPRGWRADVAYVPSGENRSHGSALGLKLRRYCNGTRFRYIFY